jgi:succinate-semialdehyde dehydrogenase/glutarate-semialdehyde dehydrogenase
MVTRDLAYIDGVWVGADSGETFEVVDPSTGAIIAKVPRMGQTETRRAVAACEAALPLWRRRTGHERSALLTRWARLIVEDVEELSQLVTLEQGKPLDEARAEVLNAAAFFEWYGEEAKRVYGDVMSHPSADKRIVVLKQPVGVTAGITPWNWPIGMPARKIASSLAAGCTMVLKPAEQTPLAALALAELGERAGLPAGVLNIVTGAADDAPIIGAELTSNPAVRQISFTGSTQVGRLLLAQCADQIKKVTLELGGNSPLIVFDDADLDAAVAGAMFAKFRNGGQVCIAANRILVQDGIYDQFCAAVAEATSQLVVGPGTSASSQIGPLIDDVGLEKVERHVNDAVARGATVLTGGQRHSLGGTYFQPSVIVGIDASMDMSREETFGPVAGIQRFTTEQEALDLANDTPYGLAGYFFTRDISRAWRVAEALEVGIAGINTGFISTETAPFGGIKQSGIGREGSRYGLEEWLEIKYVCFGDIGES